MEKAIDRRIAEIELDKRIEKKREQICKNSNNPRKKSKAKNSVHNSSDEDNGEKS